MSPNNPQVSYRMPGMPFRATAPQDYQNPGDDGSTESEDAAAANNFLAATNATDLSKHWNFDANKKTGNLNSTGQTFQQVLLLLLASI